MLRAHEQTVDAEFRASLGVSKKKQAPSWCLFLFDPNGAAQEIRTLDLSIMNLTPGGLLSLPVFVYVALS